MKTIRNNEKLMAEIGRIAEVAGYLWTKGWAERNGGNISVNLTDLMNDVEKALPALGPAIPLQEAMTALAGHIFYVTGTGKRMRYVAQEPLANGSLIRIAGDGKSYDIIAEQLILPTSELPSHLMMHNYLRGLGIVPYEIPGTLDLARATIKQLEKHDVVFWEKHGILAVGEDLIECFDAIDTLSKSAQIYFSARMAGYEPAGMTDKQLDDLVPAFGL